MKRQSVSASKTKAVIVAFLEAHYAQTHSNDVGPILGLLSLLRIEPPASKTEQHQWNEAVSLALTGYATAGVH